MADSVPERDLSAFNAFRINFVTYFLNTKLAAPLIWLLSPLLKNDKCFELLMGFSPNKIRESYRRFIEPSKVDFAEDFYTLVFNRFPMTQKPFLSRHSTMGPQSTLVAHAVDYAVKYIDRPLEYVSHFKKMGARHNNYEVTLDMYYWVGAGFILTLKEQKWVGQEWDLYGPHWVKAYTFLEAIMMRGQAQAAG